MRLPPVITRSTVSSCGPSVEASSGEEDSSVGEFGRKAKKSAISTTTTSGMRTIALRRICFSLTTEHICRRHHTSNLAGLCHLSTPVQHYKPCHTQRYERQDSDGEPCEEGVRLHEAP